MKNPANGQIVSKFAVASPDEIRDCTEFAQEVFESGIWSKAPVQQRSNVLSKIAQTLEQRVDEIAELETLQTGRTIREMKTQISRLPEWL